MATLTIKNIPDSLYKSLKQQATINHRSINSEVIVSLEKILMVSKVKTPLLLKKIRQNRIKLPRKITEKQLKMAKNKGRE